MPAIARNVRIGNVVWWTAIVIYFLLLAGDGLNGRFAADDPMNLAGYYQKGFREVVLDNIFFFNGAYRPLGGVYYLSVFSFAHLNPFPYHSVILAILIANLVVAYRFVLL